MAKTSLKQQFLRLLRDVMRRNGVRQAEVARRLGMSASAISQVMNGVLLPSQRRLDQLFEILHPEVKEAEELQRMLYWLRSGREFPTSGNNRRLFVYSIFFGAFFLLVADTLARTIAAPSELPVGSITALAGAPYFIYLLLRK